MKRVARDFTVTMEVPNNTPLSRCEIVIKVETASYVTVKGAFAKVKGSAAGKNVQIVTGAYFSDGKA
jgi:hypothetical protein